VVSDLISRLLRGVSWRKVVSPFLMCFVKTLAANLFFKSCGIVSQSSKHSRQKFQKLGSVLFVSLLPEFPVDDIFEGRGHAAK
jgi:hypothetical protein